MKILYIGGLYPEELLPYFNRHLKKCRLQDAANVYQYAVLEGLVENRADFYTLSFPFLPCYPHNFARIRIPEAEIKYDERTVGKSVSYSSLVLYKPYSIKRNLKHHFQEWVRKNIKDDERFTVLTYSYEYFFIEPLIALKKKFPNMQIASIITDLNDDASSFGSNRSLLKQIQMAMVRRRVRDCIKGIDKFILLTRFMAELIPGAADKSIVIEGIYRNSDNVSADRKIPKSLLYTGTFQEFAGVCLLVNAFMRTTDPEFSLILCGSGPCSGYIAECAKIDSRIKLLGRVDRDEAVRMQKSVAMLINPRQPNGGITRYSFPSKTMEYMSSGTPMIGYRLEGIPDEYFEYMYVPDDLTEEALARTIDQVLTLQEDALALKGVSARKFILKNKTAKVQLEKLIDFIEK